MMAAIRISSNFDAGAIDVIDIRDAGDPVNIRLAIRRDSHADFRQWFHFRLHGANGRPVVLRIENAGECAYPDGWQGYRVVASCDRQKWFRIPDTAYDGQVVTCAHTPQADSIWYAYFEPYSHERHQDLVARAQAGGAALVDLCSTLEGRDLDLLRFGAEAGARPKVWIIARQHPGETMAEWFCEGLIERLLDPADPVARRVRGLATLYIVPNINPDGAVRGNLRSNAAGANLNREWASPSMARGPEVLHTLTAMRATGCDLFLDIHGDETLPYVFADGCSMLPGFSAGQAQRERRFLAAFAGASPDFQTTHGYAPDRFTDEILTLASKQIGHAFGCLSLTLEMPFKDNADLPDPHCGWNGARSKRLGAAILLPILDDLRNPQ
jgi:murein tripeptide amidase MpaA